jgi:hypothetical protein
MFPDLNICKYTWTPRDGKTHSQIEHILIDKRRHSCILDVRSFRAADCVSANYLMVENIKERLTVNEQKFHRFDMEMICPRKLKSVEGEDRRSLSRYSSLAN